MRLPDGRGMRWLAFVALSLLIFGTRAFPGEAPLLATRTLVEQWVEARQLISRTRAEGDSMKDLLARTKAIHERELEGLKEALTRSETNSTQMALERAQHEQDLAQSTAALERVKGMVETLEAAVREFTPMLPPPLLEMVQPVLNRIPEGGGTTRAGTTERLQTVVTLLGEIDKFHQTITVTSGRQADGQGREVSVDLIYLGLGAAYFTDANGDVAGVGVPGKDGWHWTLKPEIGGAVREAIAMYRNSKPAAFVGLPLTIRPENGGPE